MTTAGIVVLIAVLAFADPLEGRLWAITFLAGVAMIGVAVLIAFTEGVML